MTMTKSLFVVLIMFSSCSDDPSVGRPGVGANPNGGGSDLASKSLAGDWAGVMQGKENGLVSGSSASAILSLELDKSFLIKSTDTAIASGKYELFGDNTTLFFNIEKSNISNFGAAGSRQSFTYQWLGADMSLKSNSIELKLKRQSARTESPVSSGGAGSKTYVGQWSCSETSDRSWLLNIRSGDITGTVSDGKSPPMTFTGVVNSDSSDQQRALARITDSNSSSSIGYQFRILRADDKTLRMGKLSSGQTSELSVTSWVDCKTK